MIPSTVRSALDPTIGQSPGGPRSATLGHAADIERLHAAGADLVTKLRENSLLLRDRSLLLNLAIEDYKHQRGRCRSLDLEQHCRRFGEFGSSIERSIFRQLEAQRFLDAHPELLQALAAPQWPEAGEMLGNFEVLEELGFGAIAHVYLCRERDLGNRRVVVKASPHASFEASILGRLDHPNIIPIYSTGFIEDRELYYLCTPYCGRSTLADLLDVAFAADSRGAGVEGEPLPGACPRDDRPLTLAANRWTSCGTGLNLSYRRRRSYVDGVLRLAIQLADALDHAHRQRILHGDLKPSNVLLTPAGQPMLLDFNLSQDFASTPAVCGGTLPYMPPEHLRLVAGRARTRPDAAFDPASDVYSFGALLYELLTGATPVALPRGLTDSSEIAGVLLDRLQRGVPPLRPLNPLISRRLEALALRCLAFDPAERPATMTEIGRQLKAETRSLAAVGRFARVRPMLFAAVVGLPLALFGGVAVHIAVQPPRHVAHYERGLRLAADGDLPKAANSFTAALAADPSFTEARFQLAKTRVALGELDTAMTDFAELANRHNDIRAIAYMGYCYNLQTLHTAAVPWYERAIRHGAESVALYNNLAASYLDAPTHHTHSERMRLAEEYLLKALELDGTSVTVQLNLVRHAERKADTDRSYDPSIIWRYAHFILNARSKDPFIQFHVVSWYRTVVRRQTSTEQHLQDQEAPISHEESSAREAFSKLYRAIGPLQPDASTPAFIAADKSYTDETRRYFLEPLSLAITEL